MAKRMLIDATQAEETRIAVMEGDRLDSYDFDSAARKLIKGNIFLAKVTRVEPSLQACFVEYGGQRQGFLAFTEIHPDYYKIPVEDRQALLAEEAAIEDGDDEEDDTAAPEAMPAQSGPADAVSAPADDFADDDTDDEEETGEGDDLPEAANLTEVPRDNTVETVGGEEDGPRRNRTRRIGRLRRRYKIQEVIKRRQIMLVQATKEERGQKGAAMTTYISLPGRYCVLMPNSPRGGGISRKVTDPQVRRKMKELLDELDLPDGMSVILRTAGMSRSRLEIKRDLEYLIKLWEEICRDTMQSVAPALIYEEADIFKRAIRDLYSPDTSEIIVAGGDGFKKVKTFMRQMVPANAKRVLFYRDPMIPLFQRFSIEKQIADIFNPRVELKSGGYIIINQTEALVAIDVNSGRATRERSIDDTALKTNLEAAAEIARQLRLRDLGGLVVIDFIDMEMGRHNAKVERKLREAMAEDRARIEIGRISGFGLLELSRQRLHPSLTETHFETCAHCAGTGLVRTVESSAVVVMRAIEAEAVKGRSIAITAALPQPVAVYMLNHKRDEMNRIEEYFGCKVTLRVDENMSANDMELILEKGSPIVKKDVEMLPVPEVEGTDDYTPEEGSDEPFVTPNAPQHARDGDDNAENGARDDRRDDRRGGRNNRRRGGGRHNRRDRHDRPAHGDTAAPDAVIIPITDGVAQNNNAVPATGPDGQPRANGDDGNRRRRGRRGGRNRHRRNDRGDRGPNPNGQSNNQGNGQANGRDQNRDQNRDQARAQPREKAMAGGDGSNGGEKRSWWQRLID